MSTYYSAYLQAMIADWRERKRMGDFTFMVMGLPPSVNHTAPMAQGDITGRPSLRLGQLDVVPHPSGLTDISGVATTLDLGGASAWGYDHPPNKNAMAQRLALQTVHAACVLPCLCGVPRCCRHADLYVYVCLRQLDCKRHERTTLLRGRVVVPVRYAIQGNITVPGSPNGVMVWTGPVLEGPVTAAASPGVTMTFTNWSAVGLALSDVRAKNIDSSDNSCSDCCAGAPPFEVQDSATKAWTRVKAAAVHVDAVASTVSLQVDSAAAVSAVRYGFDDFVQCVLVNSDGLPAAPFVAAVAAAEAAPAKAVALKTTTSAPERASASAPAPPIQSPPLGASSRLAVVVRGMVKGALLALKVDGWVALTQSCARCWVRGLCTVVSTHTSAARRL